MATGKVKKTWVEIQATSLANFEQAINEVFATMGIRTTKVGWCYANWASSITNGGQSGIILTKGTNDVNLCFIESSFVSGIYYSGEWHWFKATSSSITPV